MICPKCKKGELQESDHDASIGICDNLLCGQAFEDTSHPYSDTKLGLRESVKERKQ